jgi:hypothetical protein
LRGFEARGVWVGGRVDIDATRNQLFVFEDAAAISDLGHGNPKQPRLFDDVRSGVFSRPSAKNGLPFIESCGTLHRRIELACFA